VEVNILDCNFDVDVLIPTPTPTSTPTPTPTPTATPTPTPTISTYSCGDGFVSDSTTDPAIFTYPDRLVSSISDECSLFNWEVFDRPNRFSIYDSTGLIATTGWVGYADYNSYLWTAPLTTPTSGSLAIKFNSTTGRYVKVEAGPADPNNPLTDSYQWNMVCTVCPTPTPTATPTPTLDCNFDVDVEVIPPPTAQITSTNISCFGGSDGSYTISNGSGGSGTGYQVAISTDSFVTYYNLPKTFSGLLANTTYTFRVKDSTGTTSDLTPSQLTQPTEQTASTTIITQPVCNSSGVVQITSSGGTFPKTYQIYEDNTFPYNDCTNGTLIQTFTNVTSGTPTRNVSGLTSSYSYCAKVTDANGCITITNQVFLNECNGGTGNGEEYYYYSIRRYDCNNSCAVVSPDLVGRSSTPLSTTSGDFYKVPSSGFGSVVFQVQTEITPAPFVFDVNMDDVSSSGSDCSSVCASQTL
jgi:hypothetical protein